MKFSLVALGAAGVIGIAGCGGSGSPSQSSSSSSSGGGGSAKSALVSACENHYSAGDFGDANSDPIYPSDPTSYCGCVMKKLLADGTSPTKITNAMTESAQLIGSSPIMFAQTFC